ncbi:MAG: glycoside hydrolase family 2 [Chloroflexi bacterium]|nr:glycoside hydrolase family 2 [Chloroflexota bacterium]
MSLQSVRTLRVLVAGWLLLAGLGIGPGMAQDSGWQPGNAPLMTAWAEEVSPTNIHPEYPRPQMARSDWLSLNGLWQLAPAAEGDAPPVGVDLPETILVPFPVESALSGVMRHEPRLWYRRLFDVPRDWDDQRLLLHFGAVDWETRVYVNGVPVGEHRGGYDAFTFDITEALVANGPQELIVSVYDPTDTGQQPRGKQVLRPEGIFYSPNSGIWQSVWLEPVPETYVTGLELTPDIDNQMLRVTVAASDEAGTTVAVAALDGGKTVGAAEGKMSEVIVVPVPKPKLWSPDQPFLYDLEVTLRRDGQTIDRVTSYFGMRSIGLAEVDGFTRIVLNGQISFQIGPLDQGYWPDGLYTAPTDAALRFDIEIAKRFGFNMIRKHVKVEPERWYYWADKLGVLVWQDMPSGNNIGAEAQQQFAAELEQMIAERRNHPSIIMWVIFNEAWGQHNTGALTARVKALDPSRLVNSASGWTNTGDGDINDVHVYVGPGGLPAAGNRASVLGEYGGLGLRTPGYMWGAGNYAYEWVPDSDTLTGRYLELLDRLSGIITNTGLSAAVYTELTDIENEVNGLLTYDRRVVKVASFEALAEAHQRLIQSVAALSMSP